MKRYLFLILLLSVAPCFAQVDKDSERKIFELINKERISAGLASLQLDEKLTIAAREHSTLSAGQERISHQFADEPTPAMRMSNAGLRFDASAENVAFAEDAEHAHAALMESSGHRKNILGDRWNSVGIGVVRHGDSIYVTEDFARKLGSYTVEEAEKRVIHFLNERRGNRRGLTVLEHPELRRFACDMAAKDAVDTSRLRIVEGARYVAALNTPNLDTSPAKLATFNVYDSSRISVGVCYAPSTSNPIATYWVAIVAFY